MRRSLLILALGALLFPAAIACGDDDDNGDGPTPTLAGTETPADGTPEDTATSTAEATETPGEDLPDFEPADSELSEDHEPEGIPQLVDVRVGEHEDYDRIVFEFEGDEMPPWEVKYVAEAVNCGSGKSVLLGGDEVLEVMIPIAQAHTPEGDPTIDSTDIVTEGAAIVQSVQTCDFEALVMWGVGTTARQPFRVLELSAPTRLVVDVEHP